MKRTIFASAKTNYLSSFYSIQSINKIFDYLPKRTYCVNHHHETEIDLSYVPHFKFDKIPEEKRGQMCVVLSKDGTKYATNLFSFYQDNLPYRISDRTKQIYHLHCLICGERRFNDDDWHNCKETLIRTGEPTICCDTCYHHLLSVVENAKEIEWGKNFDWKKTEGDYLFDLEQHTKEISF